MHSRSGRAGVVATVSDLTSAQYKRFRAWCIYDVQVIRLTGEDVFDNYGVMSKMSVSVSEYARLTGTSKATARRDLIKLREAGIMDIADVKVWRPDARRYYYGYTVEGWRIAQHIHDLNEVLS